MRFFPASIVKTPVQRAWVVYDLANASFALCVRTVFAPMFFKIVADGLLQEGAATAVWGYAASAAGIAAGIFSVTLGHVADRVGGKKYFLLAAVLLGVLSSVLLAFVPIGAWKTALFLCFLGMAAYMMAGSFYDALLPEIAPQAQRHGLSSLAYAWGYIGGVIPFVGCLVLFSLFPESGKLLAMRISFLVAAVWWIVLTLPLMLRVPAHFGPTVPAQDESAGNGWSDVLALIKDRNIVTFLIAYFLYIDGVGTIYMQAVPLAMDVGISPELLVYGILGLQFWAFPCTLLYGKFAKTIAPRKMVIFGIGAYVTVAVLVGVMTFVPSLLVRQIIFLCVALTIGAAQGGIQALSRSLFSALVPPERAAAGFGIYNIFGKFTTILGPVLIGFAVWLTGYSTVGVLMLIVPFCLGAWLLCRVKLPKDC